MTLTADLAARIIQTIEGLKLVAYRDTGGVLTVGFGHTRGVVEGMVITRDQAYQFFEDDVRPLLALVTNLNPIEGSALVSFGFNCGVGAMRRALPGGDIQVTLDGFLTPDNKLYGQTDRKGNLLPGLIARRRLEAGLVVASRAS